jgi:hypothetical protein
MDSPEAHPRPLAAGGGGVVGGGMRDAQLVCGQLWTTAEYRRVRRAPALEDFSAPLSSLSSSSGGREACSPYARTPTFVLVDLVSGDELAVSMEEAAVLGRGLQQRRQQQQRQQRQQQQQQQRRRRMVGVTDATPTTITNMTTKATMMTTTPRFVLRVPGRRLLPARALLDENRFSYAPPLPGLLPPPTSSTTTTLALAPAPRQPWFVNLLNSNCFLDGQNNAAAAADGQLPLLRSVREGCLAPGGAALARSCAHNNGVEAWLKGSPLGNAIETAELEAAAAAAAAAAKGEVARHQQQQQH